MALREDQIVRYGRQILLREVGGRGQERILSSPVRVLGSGPVIDDAIAWLASGGTPVEGTASSGFLVPITSPSAPPLVELLAHGEEGCATLQNLVVVGKGVAFRTESACDSCWKNLLSTLEPAPQPAPAGALAALTAQRIALGWAEPLGLVRWTGIRFENVALPACSHR